MGRLIDLSGREFGRLTVLERAENSGIHTMWKCVCSCTDKTVCIVSGSNLVRGSTQSCGCLRKEMMGEKAIDLTGQKFGRLTVLKRAGSSTKGKATWHCKCDCGNECTVGGSNLRRGTTKSCGCLCVERIIETKRKHGKSKSRPHWLWDGMKQRCYNPNNARYKDWGGRGIAMCSEWTDKESGFNNFYNWAMSNGYEEHLTIDRIDNDKDYSPDNCRWATQEEQSNNRKTNRLITYKGKTQNLKQWADEYNISYGTLWMRIRRGWTIKKALENLDITQNVQKEAKKI